MVGAAVGALVGAGVGTTVGAEVGISVGAEVGADDLVGRARCLSRDGVGLLGS